MCLDSTQDPVGEGTTHRNSLDEVERPEAYGRDILSWVNSVIVTPELSYCLHYMYRS